MSDPIYAIEPSEFDKRLCIKCMTYATQDNIFISQETFFPMQLFSGGMVCILFSSSRTLYNEF